MRCTEIIFDQDKTIKCILSDELLLFMKGSASGLDEIIPEGSQNSFSSFLDILMKQERAYNRIIEINQKEKLMSVHFSGIFWMDYFVVCISDEEIQIRITSDKESHDENSSFFKSVHAFDIEIDEFNQISRLNDELSKIQRELTKKNINLASLIGRLEELATTDPLTGIYNRRAILERAETEITRASREGRAYGLAILDLDDFKKVNDQFGHQMGDKALKITSTCLRESTRQYDTAGRIGGDEFMVFFAVDSKEQFKRILSRVLNDINQHHMDISGELTIRIKASIGAVYVDSTIHDQVGITRLMKKADDALYNAKDMGGNNIKIEEL